MIAFHFVQVVLFLVVTVLVAERTRVLLFRAPLDTAPFLRALRAAIEDGDEEHARAIAGAGRPAWVAEVAAAGLREGEPAERAAEAEELGQELRFQAMRRLRALRVLASAATALGFLGAIYEVIWMLSGDHGLAALKAGHVEQIAMQGAMLSMALGVTTSVFAFVSLTALTKAATQLLRDLRSVADVAGEL